MWIRWRTGGRSLLNFAVSMQISIIIPVFNEEKAIGKTLEQVRQQGAGKVGEVIVVDAGSEDDTVGIARKYAATVVKSPDKGRAAQMNFGAARSHGDILYFLHADSVPPDSFAELIVNAVTEGADAGCFRLAFDRDHPLLNGYAWFTRFDLNAFRFGDQSLFVRRPLFEKIGGFREELMVMEDNEIIPRLKQRGTFRIIPEKVITSARKYAVNGELRLQCIFTLIYTLYHLGVSQETLVDLYQNLVRDSRR